MCLNECSVFLRQLRVLTTPAPVRAKYPVLQEPTDDRFTRYMRAFEPDLWQVERFVTADSGGFTSGNHRYQPADPP